MTALITTCCVCHCSEGAVHDGADNNLLCLPCSEGAVHDGADNNLLCLPL